MPHQRERNGVQAQVRVESKAVDDHGNLLQSFRFAVRFSYDGTDYRGFQSQPHGDTVQDQIEFRLGQMLKRQVRVFGCGRTDTGVHALNACFHVDLLSEELDSFMPQPYLSKGAIHDSTQEVSLCSDTSDVLPKDDRGQTLQHACKVLLSTLKDFACNGRPGTISATRVSPVPKTFDAKFSVISKLYEYTLLLTDRVSPFLRLYAWQMEKSLDVSKMIAAAKVLSGRHDFEWLAVMEQGENRSSSLTMELEVEQQDAGGDMMRATTAAHIKVIRVRAKAKYFLYKLVRRIVGVLVGVGSGEIDIDYLRDYVREIDERAKGGKRESVKVPRQLLRTAPASGLVLQDVHYDIDV